MLNIKAYVAIDKSTQFNKSLVLETNILKEIFIVV